MAAVCFDFDGVIHSYKSGWKGAAVIPDPPVEGIKEVIQELKDEGYTIAIHSTRAIEIGGRYAIAAYCKEHGIPYDAITATKPPAMVYVDDRGLKFDGKTEGLVEQIKSFHSWVERDARAMDD